MKRQFTVPGRLPGLNDYINAERGKGGKYKAARMKKDAQELIEYMAKVQLHGVHYDEPVTIHYLWVEKDKRRDKDNIAFAKKFIQDSLVELGIINDDGWKEIKEFTDDFDVDVKNPRVEVTIECEEKEGENEGNDMVSSSVL